MAERLIELFWLISVTEMNPPITDCLCICIPQALGLIIFTMKPSWWNSDTGLTMEQSHLVIAKSK